MQSRRRPPRKTHPEPQIPCSAGGVVRKIDGSGRVFGDAGGARAPNRRFRTRRENAQAPELGKREHPLSATPQNASRNGNSMQKRRRIGGSGCVSGNAGDATARDRRFRTRFRGCGRRSCARSAVSNEVGSPQSAKRPIAGHGLVRKKPRATRRRAFSHLR